MPWRLHGNLPSSQGGPENSVQYHHSRQAHAPPISQRQLTCHADEWNPMVGGAFEAYGREICPEAFRTAGSSEQVRPQNRYADLTSRTPGPDRPTGQFRTLTGSAHRWPRL